MHLGSYTILRELSAKSFLAHDAGGRRVVLKLLPPDCMLEGQLNPNIAERLRRVREIAMTDVANLRGVERDGDRAFLVWDFVDGAPFTPTTNRALIRELVHTVQQFHSTGLVHGALHPGNVLVDDTGRIKLIDVSPLLFLDPQRDEQALLELCRNSLSDQEIVRVQESEYPLEVLAAQLSETTAQQTPAPQRSRLRTRTLLAAILILGMGIAITLGVQRYVRRNQAPTLTPPRISR